MRNLLSGVAAALVVAGGGLVAQSPAAGQSAQAQVQATAPVAPPPAGPPGTPYWAYGVPPPATAAEAAAAAAARPPAARPPQDTSVKHIPDRT